MLKIGSIVINCKDFDATYRFWKQALGYVTREEHPTPDFVILRDPEGTGPNVSVQETDELKFGRNRMHLDLYASDQKAEVERLVRLGATVHRLPEGDEDYVVMADPEGKLFCVVQV